MKVLIFDISNLMMRCLFAQIPSPTETKFREFKMTFLSSFMKVIKDNNPDKVIVVEDSESWRKEIYPDYKANRAAKRETSVVNFDVFFPVFADFLEKLQKCFGNIQFMKIPRSEADDIIAVIVKNKPEWEIINVSGDKDFYQLYQFRNYRQFDGVKHEFIECFNPEQELLVKIIRGDKGDNIPGLKRGVGPVKALNIINENLDKWIDEQCLRDRYELNTKLISFKCIPKDIELAIMENLNNFVPGKFDGKQYFKFVQMEGLPGLMTTLAEYSEIIKKLK